MPVPPALLEALDLVHGIRELQGRRGKGRGVRLWPWSRMTGWRAVHAVMEAAGLDGPHASPKGLRHGFGVAAVSAGIPSTLAASQADVERAAPTPPRWRCQASGARDCRGERTPTYRWLHSPRAPASGNPSPSAVGRG